MKRIYNTFLVTALLLGSLAMAEQSATCPRFWTCTIKDPKVARVAVRLENITSVALHTYNIGPQTIREVTIDTTGNNSIRIYCLNVNDTSKRMASRTQNTRDLIDSKTGGATKHPSKKFPEGTYSHNVEYQVESVKDIEKIYDSVIKAVFSNRGEDIKIQ